MKRRSIVMPNFYLGYDIVSMLIGPRPWQVIEQLPETWPLLYPYFARENTLAVFSSGIVPTVHFGMPRHLVGVDSIRIENKPKRGELPLNVDHYVIGHPNVYGFPVYGSMESGARAPHHLTLDDLDPYYFRALSGAF